MRNRHPILKLAQENNNEITEVSGTGKNGRITRKDIEKVIDTGSASPVNESQVDDKPLPTTQRVGDLEIPVTGIRKVIAQNMVRSTQEIPHAWMTVEVDVTDLVRYRNKIKDEFKQQEGFTLTYFSFFVKAVAQALKEYPQLNSTWAVDKIIQRKDVNLSIAVAKDRKSVV